VRSQFDTVPALVDSIDTRNARFSGVALRRLRYLLHQDRRTEAQLEYLVEALAQGAAAEVDLDFDVFRCELLGRDLLDSLYQPPQQRHETGPQLLETAPVTDPTEIRRKMGSKVERRFSRKRIEAFVAGLLRERREIAVADLPVTQDDEFVRLMFVAEYGLDRRIGEAFLYTE
jgi:hypothetical protein